MGEVEILHRIYTNAAEGGLFQEPGARAVTLEERDLLQADLPVIRRAVDDLLETTAPAGTEDGYAVLRYTGDGNETYGCLVVSYPGLFKDATGRDAFLNHARLVRVSEPALDAAALFEVVGDFPRGEVCAAEAPQRRNAYLGKVGMEDAAIPVRPVAAAGLQDVPRELLTDFLIALLVYIGQKKGELVLLPDADPAKLVRAWAALPLALQRRSSWAVGVASCPVDVVFARSQGKPATSDANKTLIQTVESYVSLLHEAPGRVDAILSNPAVTTAGELREAVFSAAPAAAEMTPIPIAGQEEMAKKNRNPKVVPDQQWDPVHPDDVADLSRQYKAMEASLRRIIDERFEALEARQRSQPKADKPREAKGTAVAAPAMATPKADGASAEPWWKWPWLPFVAVVLIALVVFAVMLWPEKKTKTPEQQQTNSAESFVPAPVYTPPEDPQTPARRAVKAAEQSKDGSAWAEALKQFLEAEPELAARAIDELSAGTPNRVDELLNEFAERVGRKEDLGADGGRGREGLRELLVQCIAYQAFPDAGVKIDGSVADVTPLIGRFKEQYGVKSTQTDATARELQSEIILRWIASRE